MTVPPLPDDQAERVARYWNVHHTAHDSDQHDNLLIHPLIQAYMSLRAFGTIVGHLDVVLAELRSRTAPGDRVLSVGVGTAAKEIAIAARLPDREFVGVDLATDALDQGREAAAAAGVANLELVPGDFNDLQLDPASYRVVLGLGAIHHIEALEAFWTTCRRGLTGDGVILAQEYVGADRFQWSQAQIDEGTKALQELVPAELKTDHDVVERMSVELLISLDPSEAVRSSEILPTAEAGGFAIEGYAGAGLGLVHPALMGQIQSFEPTDWDHNQVLAALFAREDALMREGVLRDDFAGFVLRPRS